MLEINCDNPVNSINNAVEEYKDILLSITPYISNQLSNTYLDFAYKAQLSRLVEAINYIINILPNLYIKDTCFYSITLVNILFWIYENIIDLINILNILNGLMILNPDCKCMTNAIFTIFMGRITNFITIFQASTNSLVQLINVVLLANSNSSIKSYASSYIPKNNYIPKSKVQNTTIYCYSNKTREC